MAGIKLKEVDNKSSLKKEGTIIVRHISKVRDFLTNGIKGVSNGALEGSKVLLNFPLNYKDPLESYLTGLSLEDATYLENALELPKGCLSARNSEYLSTTFFEFSKATDEILDLSAPYNQLKYAVLLANREKVVFSNETRLDKPNAEFEIIDDDVKSEAIISKTELEFSAIEAYRSLSSVEMKNVLITAGIRTDSLSENKIKEKIALLVKNEPQLFLKLVQESKEPLTVMVNEWIYYHIIEVTNSGYATQDDKRTLLGRSKNDVKLFIQDPVNKDLVNILNTRLNIAKKG